MTRKCEAGNAQGQPCGALPIRNGPYCIAHRPEYAEAVARARRLGGLHRRREIVTTVVHDLEGLDGHERTARLMEIAEEATLRVEDPAAKARILSFIIGTRLRTLDQGELVERIRTIERAITRESGGR